MRFLISTPSEAGCSGRRNNFIGHPEPLISFPLLILLDAVVDIYVHDVAK